MTMSEFDTLRADITGLRADLQSQVAALRGDLQGQVAALRTDLQTQIAAVRSDMDSRFTRVDIRLERLEAKIDEKPGAATFYQASLATFTGMFAVVAGAIIVLKTTGFIP
jgi:hypothetical protein